MVQHGGHSSVGRAPACGAGGRGFKSRCPPQMGEVQTLDKSLHSLSGLNLSLFLRFGRPVQGVHLLLCVAERTEGCFVLDSNITLFLDEDSVEERLVTQPPVRVVSTLINADDIGEQPERVVKVRPSLRILVVMCFKPVLNVTDLVRDAILLLLQQINRYCSRVVGLQ